MSGASHINFPSYDINKSVLHHFGKQGPVFGNIIQVLAKKFFQNISEFWNTYNGYFLIKILFSFWKKKLVKK